MIISSIDIMDGKAVQLRQGREKVLERDNVEELASKFGQYGELAVIDLDAAFGKGENELLIRRLCTITECRVGGGIRTIARAKKLFANGAAKIIVGSSLFKDGLPDTAFLEELSGAVGKKRIIAAIDARNGEIVIDAWRKKTGIPFIEAARKLEPYCGGFLFTSVAYEGMLGGVDWEQVRNLRAMVSAPITVAGGVRDESDVVMLEKMGCDAQVGMALYTGKISLERTFIEILNWEKTPLIPTIVQDVSGAVLMLAYSTRESLAKTFATRKATYFSRSRNTLWTKGETSSNIQEFIKTRLDCDRDAILFTVRQNGPACHTGSGSCFGEIPFSERQLYTIIENRLANRETTSYTASLTDALLREKIMEEAEEVCAASDFDNKVWEAADLLYFLTVFMAKEGIPVERVMNELQRRNRK